MERLIKLSQDKATLNEIKEFAKKNLEAEIISKTLKGENTNGYKEASEIINKTIKKIDDLFKEKKVAKLNQSE